MLNLDRHPAGRHFLQIPGPSPVPDRILRAIDRQVIDHRGPEFATLGLAVIEGMQKIFRTRHPVVIYPSSGTGGWEAALVNTLSPGDRVLMVETGHFSNLWKKIADRLGLQAEVIGGDWRQGVDPAQLAHRLTLDPQHTIRAVCCVHNETSTGATSDIAAVRRAIDATGHPALLMVDTVSGLGAADYRHDEWGVDVSVAGSQKGLMMPSGLAFNAVSPKALQANKAARLPRSYWAWDEIIAANGRGYWPYTPSTNLLYGLAEAIEILLDQGLEQVFARHQRHAAATRAAVAAWGLEVLCRIPQHHSPVLTAVLMPNDATGQPHDADRLRQIALDHFDVSLGMGLSKVAGRVFRIGHLGDFNDLTLLGTLAGIEMALGLAAVPHRQGGVQAAMEYLQKTVPSRIAKAKPTP
jgi:alanine-glyoxylate transaminase/serine-glyoxylate transaminase/serine-pyruvate transaminase